MSFSPEAEKELKDGLEILKEEMQALRLQRHNPFIKNGKVDIDAYIEFVTEFNEFINHAPKPFEQIIDCDMRL